MGLGCYLNSAALAETLVQVPIYYVACLPAGFFAPSKFMHTPIVHANLKLAMHGQGSNSTPFYIHI